MIARVEAARVDRARRALLAALGPSKIIDDPDLLPKYGQDYSFSGLHLPDLVVFASSTEDIQAVFRIATEHQVPVTPRGLGSGKSGGALPIAGGIVLGMEWMKSVKEISRADLIAVAEPGIITQDFMNAVEAEGLFYPPDPNSLAISSLGGNVACNAGGPRALKYGVTRNYVLALEVVLPTGERLNLGRRTQKGVTGYDLVGLFVGSEGTLGVITEITTRLISLPAAVQTALVSFADAQQATLAVGKLFERGLVPRTLEFLDHHALAALRHKTPGRFPEDAGAVLIVETDARSPELAMEEMERIASACLELSALDVLVAQDAAQRERIWEPRRVLSMTLAETAETKMSEDVVVPRSKIPALLAAAEKSSRAHGIRVATYGHAGDGNLHVNVLYKKSEKDRADRVVLEMMEATVALGGTISGEHGIGLTKRDFIAIEQSAPLLELQRRMKDVFDPARILNPGKIFPARGARE